MPPDRRCPSPAPGPRLACARRGRLALALACALGAGIASGGAPAEAGRRDRGDRPDRDRADRPAPTEAAPSVEAAALDRLRRREAKLDEMSADRDAEARAAVFAAYRLGQRRRLDALGAPGHKLAAAQAMNLAIAALDRPLEEARLLREEADRQRQERLALERQLEAGAPAGAAASDPRDFLKAARPPARGAVVGAFGARAEEGIGVELRRDGVLLLVRATETVRAVAAGRVARVAPLPQGGFAVVVLHDDRWVSVVSGLRAARVREGQEVGPGHELGPMGRTLDGAPVLGFELWHARRPVDPTPVVDRGARPGGKSLEAGATDRRARRAKVARGAARRVGA